MSTLAACWTFKGHFKQIGSGSRGISEDLQQDMKRGCTGTVLKTKHNKSSGYQQAGEAQPVPKQTRQEQGNAACWLQELKNNICLTGRLLSESQNCRRKTLGKASSQSPSPPWQKPRSLHSSHWGNFVRLQWPGAEATLIRPGTWNCIQVFHVQDRVSTPRVKFCWFLRSISRALCKKLSSQDLN